MTWTRINCWTRVVRLGQRPAPGPTPRRAGLGRLPLALGAAWIFLDRVLSRDLRVGLGLGALGLLFLLVTSFVGLRRWSIALVVATTLVLIETPEPERWMRFNLRAAFGALLLGQLIHYLLMLPALDLINKI